MKKLFLCFVLSLLMAGTVSVYGQNKPIEKANYELASRFSPKKLEKMVFSTTVDAHWLKNSDRFWYAFQTTNGKTYYIVDPAMKSKKVLFDNANMAAQMSRLTKDPFDAQNLSIDKIKFIKNESIIQFEIMSKLIDEDKKDAEDKKDDEENDMRKDKKDGAEKKAKKTFYFEYDLKTAKLTLLEDYKKPKDNPKWANISPDGEKIVFVTNINKMKAKEITQIYKSKWQIEIFFKFIKQYLNCNHLLNRSENGIKVVMYVTMITAILIAQYKNIHNLKGYKIAKRKFVQHLETDIIYNIVILCGGDAKKAKGLLYKKSP